jgi:hypothetical protein
MYKYADSILFGLKRDIDGFIVMIFCTTSTAYQLYVLMNNCQQSHRMTLPYPLHQLVIDHEIMHMAARI